MEVLPRPLRPHVAPLVCRTRRLCQSRPSRAAGSLSLALALELVQVPEKNCPRSTVAFHAAFAGADVPWEPAMAMAKVPLKL